MNKTPADFLIFAVGMFIIAFTLGAFDPTMRKSWKMFFCNLVHGRHWRFQGRVSQASFVDENLREYYCPRCERTRWMRG